MNNTKLAQPYRPNRPNRPGRPVAVIDVDGVLLNFTKGFAKFWNKNYPMEHICPTNPSDWYFDYKGPREIINTMIRQYVNTYPMLELMETDVPNVLSKLSKRYHITIVTAYPHEESRKQNLALHNIPYDNLICVDANDKVKTILALDPEFVVEDCPEHVEKLSNWPTFDKHIFVPRRWNYTKKLLDLCGVVGYHTLKEIELYH